MKLLESKGLVHRIIEDEGDFLIAVLPHDGYFTVPDAGLQQAILQAHDEKKEITFRYDQNLTLTELL